MQDINPVFVLMRIIGEGAPETGVSPGIPYWVIYTVVYLAAGALLLYWSARLLSPRKKGTV